MASQTARIEINGNILHLNHPRKTMIHDLAVLVQNRPESKNNTTPYCSTWFFGWTWFLPHGWFGKTNVNLLQSSWTNPKRATFPRILCCPSQGSQPNTTAVCGRILTKIAPAEGSPLWPKLFWSGKHGFNMKESKRGFSSLPSWEQWVWPSYALYLWALAPCSATGEIPRSERPEWWLPRSKAKNAAKKKGPRHRLHTNNSGWHPGPMLLGPEWSSSSIRATNRYMPAGASDSIDLQVSAWQGSLTVGHCTWG